MQEALRRGVTALERGRVRRALPAQPHRSASPAPTARRRPPSSSAPSSATPACPWPSAATSATRSPACRRRCRPRPWWWPSSPASSSSTSSAFAPTWPSCSTSPRTTSTATATTAATSDAKLRIFENQSADGRRAAQRRRPGHARGGRGRTPRAAAAGAPGSRSTPGRDGRAWRRVRWPAESTPTECLWLDARWVRRRLSVRRPASWRSRATTTCRTRWPRPRRPAPWACPPPRPPRRCAPSRGVPHRLQVAGVVGGVTYVNDSKATNVDATLKALTAYTGGRPPDPRRLRQGRGVRRPGRGHRGTREAGPADRRDGAAARGGLRRQGRRGRVAGHIRRRLRRPRRGRAGGPPREAAPGDVVLLSPACASWDQYRDYVERGEHFLKLVNDLRGAGPS